LAEESEEDIRQFFNEFDFNRDGKISRDEFKKILIEKTDQMN
jgi:Ca2+-binding EF-hand superfamily protein